MALLPRLSRAHAGAPAQNYPTQRVTIVVPFGAGSVTDILARILAEDSGKRWGQQVIVENRPGLAGTAGVAQGGARRLHADGDLEWPHGRGPGEQAALAFDPVKDFAGITRLASSPLYLITHPEVPAQRPSRS